MPIFSRTPVHRDPHHEPGFNQADFVAEYSEQTLKHAVEEHKVLLQFAAKHLQGREHQALLDIGSGPGWIPIRLAQKHSGLRVTGLDVSPEFVAIANQNKIDEEVGEQIEFIEGDAQCLDRFADRSFDVVISNQSLHYWTEPQIVFDQIARILRPGGVFCISDDRRDMTVLGRFQVFLGRHILSKRIGASWKRSLDGCFSSQEVKDLLQKSALRDCWTMSLSSRGMLITSQ